MYFWKIDALKNDIKDKKMNDEEIFPYIILSVAFYAFLTEIMAYLPYEDGEVNTYTYVLSIMAIIIQIFGTIYVYKKNGAKDGNNFLTKYFLIGFVVSIRFIVYFIPLMIALIIYWKFNFSEQELLPTTLFEVVLISAWYLLLFFNIGKHIEDV